MDIQLPEIGLILATGAVAGVLNTLAGGGSLLTLPVLIFFGLPSATANGTNRVAIVLQNVVAVTGYRRKGKCDFRLGLILSLPALVGAWLGAELAVSLDDAIFDRVLAGVMLLVLALILWRPTTRGHPAECEMTSRRRATAMLIFFFVGLYGGFIQAGVGFLIILALTLTTQLDLVAIQGVKVFVILLYTVVALLTFGREGHINWTLGLTLAVGTSAGAWLGTHLAVKKGETWIRAVLVLAVLAFATKLAWSG